MSRSKNNTIKTYGRHRQRVITADIWIRDEEKQADFGTGLFSGSDNGSLDSSDQNSTNNSLFAGQVTRSSKKTMRGKNKENAGKVHNRRVLRKRLASDGDSCSSTGSDSLFRSSRPRRALKDRNYNEQVSEKCGYGGKRKRVPKTVQTCQKSDSLSSVTNFSEFEDYSLVISGSPVQNSSPHTKGGIFSPHQLRSQSKIETSTPCAKRTCSANDINNLSVIDHVEEDISLSATDNLEQSSCAGKSLPRVCNVSEVSTTNKSVFRNSEDASHTSPVNTCLVQMEKLRQSVLSMHVSHRNSKQSNADFSDSLFSSFDEKSSSQSCVTAESKLESEENNEKDAETEEESEDDDLSKISEEENNEEEDKNVTKFMLVSPEIDNFYSAQSSLSSRGSPDVSVNKSPDVSVNKSLNKSHFEILTPQRQQSVPTVLPRSRVLEVCQQEDIETFQSCITSSMMRQCRKVGEGVYGEVFRTKRGQNSVALKIIPVEGDFEVNDEKQKTFEEILPEIVISVELSLLRDNEQCYTKNFCEVQRVSCVKGKYPSKLLTEWNTFHEEKGSENDNPVMFKENQLFIMFEFADGGKDLESAQDSNFRHFYEECLNLENKSEESAYFKFNNIFEAKSVFEQVTFSLAVAEEALQFEHRDLHWGNVLVKKTDVKVVDYVVLGQSFQVESHGVQVSIIDFTLSRLDKDGCITYSDLSKDETLFEGTGDYQFDIYRKMKELNQNDWKVFRPQTNVFWLHYLADKLIRGKRYKRNTKMDQGLLRDFRNFSKEMLNYSSACDMLVSSDFFSS